MLLGGLAAGAASMVPSFGTLQRAIADSGPTKRRFVFLYLPGGWDQLLFLDPREAEFAAGSEAEYEAEVERTGIDTRYRFSGAENSTLDRHGPALHRASVPTDPDFYFGPAALRTDSSGTPDDDVNLTSLVDRGIPMAMVRGINMGTLGHEPGYLYFLTGEPSSGSAARGTSMPIRMAAQLGDIDPLLGDTLLSTVALSMDSYTGDSPGRYAALRAHTVDDLERILARSEGLRESAAVEAALARHAGRPLTEGALRYDAEGLLSAMASSSATVRDMLDEDLATRFRFLDSSDDESAALRRRYRIGDVSRGSERRGAGAAAAFVSLAIKTGFGSVHLRLGFGRRRHPRGGQPDPRGGAQPSGPGDRAPRGRSGDQPGGPVAGRYLDGPHHHLRLQRVLADADVQRHRWPRPSLHQLLSADRGRPSAGIGGRRLE